MVFEELKEVFQSDTIKPSFSVVHVILALILFKSNPEGLGRYRLMEELLIGSGTARSLITKLQKKTYFLSVTTENKRKGHKLTENGLKYVKKIEDKIPVVKKGDLSVLKELIIDSMKAEVYLCLVKKAAQKIKNGVEQRDAAIIIGGFGATCLVYDGNKLVFPVITKGVDREEGLKIGTNIQLYIKDQKEISNALIEKNDVIIIGFGDTSQKARLAALNAALTLM